MHLHLIAKPPSMTDFLIRFNEYFPHLNKLYGRKSPRLFWSDISSKEIVELSKLGVDCCRRVQETVNWATEHVGKGFVLGLYTTLLSDDLWIAKSYMSLFGQKIFEKHSPYPAKKNCCWTSCHTILRKWPKHQKKFNQSFPPDVISNQGGIIKSRI